MRRYELTESGLVAYRQPSARSRTGDLRSCDGDLRPPPGRRTIDQVLAEARTRLDRLTPRQALRAVAAGAVLVDIRPAAQRAAEGEIPGALIVERNVLEWRFDPASAARLPQAGYDLQVIIVCSEGYTSSLAAAALQDLGVRRATDLEGGFLAWQAAGLPVVRSQQRQLNRARRLGGRRRAGRAARAGRTRRAVGLRLRGGAPRDRTLRAWRGPARPTP